MAVVTRYFSESAAGAGDGTSWADRAAFVVTGAINTIISAFDFTSDSLIARVGPGTYTLTTGIATFTGTTGPVAATFPCLLEAALSDGSRWTPPNPDWCSAQPAWDHAASGHVMPIITTSTNIPTVNNANVGLYGIRFVATGRNGQVVQNFRSADWCQSINETSNDSAVAWAGAPFQFTNCFGQCSGTGYSTVANAAVSNSQIMDNVRLQGNPSASSGNRFGWTSANNATYPISRLTTIGNVGGGIFVNNTSNTVRPNIRRCTIVAGGGIGIDCTGTASSLGIINQCMITGAHSHGVNITGSTPTIVNRCRIRDATTAATAGLPDWTTPPLNGNDTSAGVDADEYVNAGAGDYRIKNTSYLWGQGIGAGDEPASGAADYPDESDVRLGVEYDDANLTGTLDLPAESDVKAGVEYDNATKEGTFAGGITVRR